jgi:diguanylate cyclase (GGDEF)-like protein
VNNPEKEGIEDFKGRLPSQLERLAQFVRERSMARSFAVYVSLSVVLALVLAMEVLLAYRALEIQSSRNSASLAFASELRASADRELNSVLFLSSGLVGYLTVRHEQIDPVEMNAILEAIYAQGRHIRNITVAIDYRPSYVVPLAGNEQILGRDYREIPGQWPSVKYAISSGSNVLTGPVKLVQGGTAMIYRVPIFIKDQYWGMLATVIDMSSFYASAFKAVDGGAFEFAVRSEETGANSGGMLWGDAALFADAQVFLVDSKVPGGKWVYAVRGKGDSAEVLPWLIRSMGWVLSLIAGICIMTVLRQRSQLAHLAGFDKLTELPNRRLFDDRLQQSMRRRERDDEAQIAVVFLDLNRFKPINDFYGHKFGDMVLQLIARRIRDEVRAADTVARWAGDEFALIIEAAETEVVAQLVERLRPLIAAPFYIGGVALSVGAAIGVAFYPSEADSAPALLELADQRMYADKARIKEKAGVPESSR